MCLAIYKPAGTIIKEEYLRNGFQNHSDGAGFAWSQDGKLHVAKGIFNVDEMIAKYNEIKDFHCLIHFRKATHGKIDAANCHPFLFNEGKLALIHNGILNIKCTIDGLSDTAHFVKLVLEPLVTKYNVPINNNSLHYLISSSIGTDKMAVMTENGDTYIFNTDKGEWNEGSWYSNSSYKWSYSKSTTGCGINGSCSYPETSPTYGHSANIQTYKSQKTWKKRFEEDNEGDEAYLEFWNQALVQSLGDGNPNTNTKTQKLPKLIGNGDSSSSSSTVTVEEVENMSDEELEKLAENSKREEIISPGHMMDYGWWDKEIEDDIATCIDQFGINREQAILRVFNRK